MTTLYNFHNDFPVANITIPNANLTSDVLLFPDDGFLSITYSGSTTSRWFKFTITALSDVIVGAVINTSTGVTRFNDNRQDQAASSTLWIDNNMTTEPVGQVMDDDDINFFTCHIDVIQDAATTPVLRSYTLRGNGRQTTLVRQPSDVHVELFRID